MSKLDYSDKALGHQPGTPQTRSSETWRGLDDARLKAAIDAFYEPCEGTTIDGIRAAIAAWEASGPDMSKVVSALKYYAQQKGDGAAAQDALASLVTGRNLADATKRNSP